MYYHFTVLKRAGVVVQFAQKFWEFWRKICAIFFEKKFDNGRFLWYNSARVRDRAPLIVKYLTICRYKKNRRFRLLIDYYFRRHSYTNNYLTYRNYRPVRNGFRKIIIKNRNKNKKPNNSFDNVNFNFHLFLFLLLRYDNKYF